jgi:signal transduction histidine kinase
VATQIEPVVRELEVLGASLIDSYQALERRAQHVENELERANAELARKLEEIAAMSERMHALDKLAALGNMAGGIAHELRNPMMAIKGFAGLLERDLAPASSQRRWAALISAGVAEAESVLTSMLSLATPEKLALESIEASELARAAVELATSELGDGAARWRVTWTATAPRFVGDRIKLRQALRNLLANALQAQPDGGRAHLAITRDSSELVARVCDAGPGLPPELRRRACEPFFTTRAEGTGLGLALCVRIAELHGGRLEIAGPEASSRSDLGGADVALRFPFRSPAVL